uniref:hypothetical protein n=1 Tax=Cupriavidus necator TaxID=106590 RepID=UPI003F498938
MLEQTFDRYSNSTEPRLRVVATQQILTDAILRFDVSYARDYRDALQASLAFLEASEDSTRRLAVPLARILIAALENWGLGRRPSAPKARQPEEVACLLLDPEVRRGLKKLAKLRTDPPRFVQSKRFVPGALYRDADELDTVVRYLIVRLADGLFTGCTQATYPMKALLLLAGYMVAFDTWVRTGTKLAGGQGMSSTNGFKRYITADNGTHYWLPDATYVNTTATSTLAASTQLISRIAAQCAPSKAAPEVFVCDWTSAQFMGLRIAT